ncbi:Arm DNA-binding domain-containing protein [Methylotuvimicrobium alcaliphilum]|uniref:Integrase DNA-binding domain-containing protein n=1 Tax=Methylotuvimicrobium alcaliphilum (strain DSM 19304 / NCIMB 14124 / VKM B-2133 / 20Z) TaxID=1091494 RepID=G4SVB6_META2|nr:Arm DNA-binding domain-containing protein [Methylotuvimicrobium alcaliphilum]CCE21892.1 protein of unknown function [Methylotuvimicrobium alcaliphilum 20Z]
MEKRFKFTQQRIEKLPVPDKGRFEYYDTEISKLICRVSSTGNKSFAVLKKTDEGTTKRVTLGRFPSMPVALAKELAQSALTEIAKGVNPTEEKRKRRYRAISLEGLLNQYLADKKTYVRKQLSITARRSEPALVTGSRCRSIKSLATW